MDNFTNILVDRFGTDEPILAEDICALFSDKPRQTVYRWLNAALDVGMMAKFSRGVYYIPHETRFGQSQLLPDQVVQRKWLDDNGDTIGYVSGPGLANTIGITDQVPAVLEVTTNRETTRIREVPAFGGWKSIRLRRPRTTVTRQNVQALRFLDIITDEPVSKLSSSGINALKALAQKAGRDQVYDCAAYYPAKTSKRLIECERKNIFA